MQKEDCKGRGVSAGRSAEITAWSLCFVGSFLISNQDVNCLGLYWSLLLSSALSVGVRASGVSQEGIPQRCNQHGAEVNRTIETAQ